MLCHRPRVVRIGAEDDLGLVEREAVDLLVLVELRARLKWTPDCQQCAGHTSSGRAHLDGRIGARYFLEPRYEDVAR